MHRFDLHRPHTIEAAAALLSQYGDDAMLLSGGTALTVLLKQGLVQPAHLISLRDTSGSTGMNLRDGTVSIRALTNQRSVEMSPLIREHVPLLAEAYRRVATIRIRNMATVGGGVAEADPSMDPPPALLALGASVTVVSVRGERVIHAEDVWTGPFETSLEPDEIVTEITVPVPPAQSNWIYAKFLPRSEDDYATVSVAAIGRTRDGIVEDVRVALGAAGPVPFRASAVETELIGRAPTAEALRNAASVVYDLADPIEDMRGSAEYKRDMAVVFTRRALERVFRIRSQAVTARG